MMMTTNMLAGENDRKTSPPGKMLALTKLHLEKKVLKFLAINS